MARAAVIVFLNRQRFIHRVNSNHYSKRLNPLTFSYLVIIFLNGSIVVFIVAAVAFKIVFSSIMIPT